MNTALTLFDFGNLPGAVRADVDRWATALKSVRKPVTPALREVAAGFAVSYPTARRKYDAWRASGGNPLSLVNRAKCPDHREALSKDFIEWLRARAERNQRKFRPVFRAFVRAWRSGETIPGLDPELPRHVLPPGCSYGNLARKVNDAFSLTVMRQGMAAAATHAPQMFSTRVGLWVGSHYMFDDLWHDNFVVFRGKVVRVVELDALDVFSGCKFAWGTKPRFQREDGTFDNIKESFMRMLLASVLFNEGYSARGTMLMVEHGTAAIAERIEQLLYDRTGGLIQTKRSGITGKEQAVAGMFWGKGGGNPRFKSPLESLRNLIHNELASLPGQTGKDVEHRPESLSGALTHTTDLLKAMAVLAQFKPERAALIRLPLLEYHSQFVPVLGDVYEQINRRDWHELEGWSDCGHVTIDYRLAPDVDQWLTSDAVLRLPPVSQQMLVECAKADARYIRSRQLSPKEVWTNGRSELQKIPAFVVGEILGDDLARECECRNSYFRFDDCEISPETLIYEGRITRPDGSEAELAADKYKVFANPFDLNFLFVHDAAGRHLGIARRVARVARNDDAALERQFGRNNKRLADLLQPIRKRHAEITREAAREAANNAALIEGPIANSQKPMGTKHLEPFAGTMEEAAELIKGIGETACRSDGEKEFSNEEIAALFATEEHQ